MQTLHTNWFCYPGVSRKRRNFAILYYLIHRYFWYSWLWLLLKQNRTANKLTFACCSGNNWDQLKRSSCWQKNHQLKNICEKIHHTVRSAQLTSIEILSRLGTTTGGEVMILLCPLLVAWMKLFNSALLSDTQFTFLCHKPFKEVNGHNTQWRWR